MHIFPQGGTSNSAWYYSELKLPVQNDLEFKPILSEENAEYEYVAQKDNHVYIYTNLNAPRYRLARVDLNDPDEGNWVDIIPEHETKVMKGVHLFNKNFLAIVYMRDVIDIIQIHELLDGKYIRTLDTPISTVNGVGTTDTELFYKLTSFLLPGIIYQYDFKTNETKVVSS